MKRPSPFVLILALLAAALWVADRPLLRVVLLGAMVAVACVALAQVLARRGVLPSFRSIVRDRRSLWAIGLIAAAATLAIFLAMVGTQPRLHTTYTPEHFGDAQEITSNRGFYPTQVDEMGNRYAWTQERATFVVDFLVHRPITVTIMMRSAAVAGGPDAPVHVEVNGVEVAQLHPDPANPNFQPFAVRFVPHDWGGQRTEIKLLTTPFKPGKGDPRTLGTMVQGVSVDKSAAWSSVERRIWLLWALPALALLALALVLVARRSRAAVAGYGAVAACVIGAGCAAALTILILRVGFIARDTYPIWVAGGACVMLGFGVAVAALPLGSPGARSILRWAGIALARPINIARFRPRLSALRPSLGEPAADTRRAIARDLLIVFLIALGVRVAWVVVIPPWQAPDEPDHFTYVSFIVEQGKIFHPPLSSYPPYSKEVTDSWGLTLFGEIASAGIARPPNLLYLPHVYDYRTARDYEAPHQDRLSNAAGRATPHPPLYYLLVAMPYWLLHNAPVLSRLFAVRCGSATLGALSCVFGYLLAYEFRRERRWGWALGLCMALLPMYVFLTSTVNNDVGMDLFATALIWLIVRVWRQDGLSRPLAFTLGLASGLTLLTKATVYGIVLVAGIVLLVKMIPIVRAQIGRAWLALPALGMYAVGVIIGYGPWALFHRRYYGDVGFGAIPLSSLFRFLTGVSHVAAGPPVTSDATVASLLAVPQYSLLSYLKYEQGRGWEYFRVLLVNTFWGEFGWLDTPMPDRAFTLIILFYAICGVGLLIQLVLQPRRRRILLLLMGLIVAQMIFLFLVVDYYQSFARTGGEFGLQGRYFFPVLAPLLLLLLSGWDHLWREHPLALRLAPVAMLALNLVGLATLLARYYGVTIG